MHFIQVQQISIPKHKFVVILATQGDVILGCLISSKSPPFKRKEEFSGCVLKVRQRLNRFLQYDSYMGVDQVLAFTQDQFSGTTKCGSLAEETQNSVIEAMNSCRLVSRKKKEMILDQCQNLSNLNEF